MPLPNPWYIDANAQHDASVLRGVAELASEGQEGVRGGAHLAIRALTTPGGSITCAPGLYSVRNTGAGSSFENYVGKVIEQETVAVSPTDSSGSRTDLVILRIENPNAVGTGSWATPADELNGPYAHIRVIEGVAANTQTVKAWNNTWTALTLARITRPANTGIVTQAHIVDLRSLIDLTVERIVVINNPPADPPPVAQQYWTESTPIGGASPPYDKLLSSDTSWQDFPELANWRVPVPSWAVGMDINILFNPLVTNNVWGEMRLVVEGEPVGAVPTEFDINFTAVGQNQVVGGLREVIMLGGTESLNRSWCGKVVTVKLQARSKTAGQTGELWCTRGTRVNAFLNFKRWPNYDDGGA